MDLRNTQRCHGLSLIAPQQRRKRGFGIMVEIGIRALFTNFCYTFGGKIFLQQAGGPIGARITMACSRLRMQDWGEK